MKDILIDSIARLQNDNPTNLMHSMNLKNTYTKRIASLDRFDSLTASSAPLKQ